MRKATQSNANELAQYYFYVLIHNPLAPEPPGLDAETATLIRRLVWEEQNREISPSFHPVSAKERVWQEIVDQTGQLSVWPPVNSARMRQESFSGPERSGFKEFPTYYDLLNRGKNLSQNSWNTNFFGWGQWVVRLGMAATVIIVSLAILFIAFAPAGISNTNSSSVIAVKPGAGNVPPSKQGSVPVSPKVVPPPPDKFQITKEASQINLKAMITPAVEDLAKLLGVESQEVLNEMQSGQTLAELAAAHNINLATLKENLTASFKRQLNEGVAAGKWTQDQSDQAINEIPNFINEVFKI